MPIDEQLISQWKENTNMVPAWLEESCNDFNQEELLSVLGLFDDKKIKSSIAESWFKKKERSFDDLKTVLELFTVRTFFDDVTTKSLITKSWLEQGDKNSEELKTALALFRDEYTKSSIAKSWFEKKERSSEDLKNVMELFREKNSKSLIATSWFEKGDRSFEELKTALESIYDEYKRPSITKSWFKKKERSFEELYGTVVLLLLRKSDSYTSSSIAESWFKKGDRSFKELANILLLLSNDTKFSIAKSWFEKKEDRNLEELKTILKFSGNESAKSSLVEFWLEKEEMNSEELKTVLELFKDKKIKFSISSNWLIRGERSLEDLKIVMELSSNEYEQHSIAEYWLGKGDRSSEELKNVLELIYHGKSSLAEYWLKKGDRSFEEFKKVLEFFDFGFMKPFITKYWFEKKERSFEELTDILEFFDDARTESSFEYSMYKRDEITKSSITESWFEKGNRNFEELKNVLELLGSDEYTKSSITKSWFEKGDRSFEELKNVLELLGYEYTKSSITKSWFEKGDRSFEKLKNVLELLGDEYTKSSITKSWFEKGDRSSEELKNVLELFDDEQKKSSIVNLWLRAAPYSEEKYQFFVNLARAGTLCGIYDVNKVYQLYFEASLPEEKFTDLCKDLYPNYEYMQTRLLKSFIENRGISLSLDAKEQLKLFISSLNDEELLLDTLRELGQNLGRKFSPLDFLETVGSHVSRKYESLRETLTKKSLEESLSEEGLETVKNLFLNSGDELPKSVNLASIFSYYDIVKDDLDLFGSILKPELLEEIRATFSPSNKSAYILDKEFEKLGRLFRNQEDHRIDLTLPKVEILSHYLMEKVGRFNHLNTQEIKDYQFGKCDLLDSFEQSSQDPSQITVDVLTARFRDLMQKESTEKQELLEFFEMALRLDGKINNESGMVLYDFFRRDKHLLALLLQQDGGLDKFSTTFSTLADGCFANIGTHARLAVCQSLIKDRCDQILFSVFQGKINAPILNVLGGVDHHSENSGAEEIFNSNRVNETFISPPGLLAEIEQEFYSGKQKVRDPWELISNQVGKGGAYFLTENLEDSDLPGNFNEKAALIASYLVLESTIPEILKSVYLQEFRDTCANLINEARIESIKKESEEITDNAISDALKNISALTPHSDPEAQKKSATVTVENDSIAAEDLITNGVKEVKEKKSTYSERFRKSVRDGSSEKSYEGFGRPDVFDPHDHNPLTRAHLSFNTPANGVLRPSKIQYGNNDKQTPSKKPQNPRQEKLKPNSKDVKLS